MATYENEDDGRQMAEENRGWDGNWLADGLQGMFVHFSEENFCEDEVEDFLEEQEAAGAALQMEHEFLKMPPDCDENGWARIHHEILHPRKLHAASGVVRRFAEGACPPQIRIRELGPVEMQELLACKKLGNEAFVKKDYEEAVKHYGDALTHVSNLFVAPTDQVKEVVNVLSNQAECYLRLKRYQDAGSAATDAMMLDSSHEKSRMRRAKAGLAIAGAPHLIQAQADLEEIVEQRLSKAGVKEAKEYLKQLEEILQMEKKTFEDQQPDSNWNFYVRTIRSTCW